MYFFDSAIFLVFILKAIAAIPSGIPSFLSDSFMVDSTEDSHRYFGTFNDMYSDESPWVFGNNMMESQRDQNEILFDSALKSCQLINGKYDSVSPQIPNAFSTKFNACF